MDDAEPVSFDRSQRTTFNDVARIYHEARPGYPEQLVEDVIALSGIPRGGRILEIGCGTGLATLPFAGRGYPMLCLELGHDLAAVAAENCRQYPRVEISNVAFEDWPLQEEAFDLVISAQAFHWITPEIGYAKAAATLAPDGCLALFWNNYPGLESELRQALDQVYAEHAPQLTGTPGKVPLDELARMTVDAIDGSGFYGPVTVKRYPWSERYTTEQYLQLLNTYSDHLCLAEDLRKRLFEGCGQVIERFGGELKRPYLAQLYLAHLKGS